MRKLRSSFGACLVCVFAAVLLFPAWMPVAEGTTGLTELFTTLSDTTYVACEDASAFYDQWYDQIDSVLRARGDSILNVAPVRKTAYSFAGACSDTVSHAFLVRRGTAPDTTLQYLLIVRDTVPPTIQSALPDSLFLRCGETIPDTAGNILISDNCALDTSIFSQVILGGDCPNTYKIVRTWDAWDRCRQRTTYQQVISIRDDTPPTFSFGFALDTTIDCSQSPHPDSLRRRPVITDNCDTMPRLYYQDVQLPTQSGCAGDYTIERSWFAVDTCGNASIVRQIIRVRDLKAPTFTVPRDTILDCSSGDHPNVAGRPSNVKDNCALPASIQVTYKDVVTSSACLNTYGIRRVWYVSDGCNNTDSAQQIIQIRDLSAPVITRQARNLEVQCDEANVDSLFWAWVAGHGDALATDNCNGPITWSARNTGTQDTISFPTAACTPGNAVVLERRVDFIAHDACGLSDTTTALFQVLDVVPPDILSCAKDTVIRTDTGQCTATFTLPAPQVNEDCSLARSAFSQTKASDLASSDPSKDPAITPVQPIVFTFALPGDRFTRAASAGVLKIKLIAVDGEGAAEYFRILAEDGSVLGRTVSTTAQCGNSETTIPLSTAQIDQWGANGQVQIRLEPFMQPGLSGAGTINPLCAGGRVEATFEAALKDFSSLKLEYRIDAGTRKQALSVHNEQVTLTGGTHTIQYYVSDCAGQTDSCSFTITVEDREAPQLTCPGDTTVALPEGACTAQIAIPLPVVAQDNCSALGGYQLRLPVDTASAYLTYDFNPSVNAYVANGRTFSFTQLGPNATDSASLTLYFKGDFSSPGATLAVRSEEGELLGSTRVGDASCSATGSLTLRIAPTVFNRWAADGKVDFSVLPGAAQSGEGIHPCDSARVRTNGGKDSIAYLFAELAYPNIGPSYFTTGATQIPLTAAPFPLRRPTHTFNRGVTTVYYLISDAHGNRDTCSFQVRVEDREVPKALCQPTTLFISPAGLESPQVSAQQIDAGSSDNCGIARFELLPNTFSCAQAGTIQDVVLTVFDSAGNSARCSTLIRVDNIAPDPSANSDLCGTDTLFLYANPPKASGGILYTYKWTGPNGFTSTRENPSIPNIGARNAGSYTVEVTGFTGCKAVGTLEIAIEDLPLTPELTAKENVCEEDAIVLNSSIAPSDPSVRYRWYRGIAPDGVLLGTTIVPSFSVAAPHSEGIQDFYLTIEVNGCISRPSAPKPIRVVRRPVAVPSSDQFRVCAGQEVLLGTEVTGPGITYAWKGPNGFSSSSQYPPAVVTTMADGGDYELVVSRYGCASPPAFVAVNIIPKPSRPEITNSGAICAGGEVTLRTSASATKYTWIGPSLLEFPTSSSSFFLSNVSKAVAGAWRVYVTVQGCQSDVSLPTLVVVNDPPKVSIATAPAVICDGGPLTLNASPAIVNATYRWSGPSNFSAVGNTASIPITRAQNAGRYSLTVTGADGCSATASTDVDVRPAVRIAAVTNDGPDCLSGPMDIRLSASIFPEDDGTYLYRWTGPNGYVSNNRIGIIPKATQLNNGNYQLLVTTAQGCVSAPSITIVDVKDPPRAPTAPQINETAPGPVCEGSEAVLCAQAYQGAQVVYNWATPNKGILTTTTPCLTLSNVRSGDSGAYAVFVTVDGCRSMQSAPTLLTVNPKPVINAVSNSPVCAGRPLELRATILSGATYEWTGPNFSSSLAIAQIAQADSAQNAGIYSVTAVLNGCRSAAASTLVRVLPTPVQPVLTAKDAICISKPGAELKIGLQEGSATPGAMYIWLGPLGPLGSTQTPEFTLSNFSNYRNGANAFSVQAQLGACSSPLSKPLEVSLNTIPEDIAFAGNDFSACDAEAIFLNGLEPSLGQGRWTLVSGPNPAQIVITSPNRGRTAVQKLIGPNFYTFRWTLSNGACADFSSDEVRVSVSRQDTAFAGEDLLVCLSPSIKLGAKPSVNGTGTWSQSSVQAQLGVRILEPANPGTSISGMQPGNLYAFTWTVLGGCGNLSDEVMVLISDPNPYAGPDQQICTLEGTAKLSADLPTSGSSGRWFALTPGVRISDSLKLQPSASQLRPGDNFFVWEIDRGICGASSRDTVIIRYTRSPEAIQDYFSVPFGEAFTVPVLKNDLYSGSVRLRISAPPDRGTLRLRNDSVLVYTPAVNYVGKDAFQYELCSNGCACTTAEVELEVGKEAGCDVPTIITPNNDGINDTFIVPCLLDEGAYPKNQVLIFNRSGQEVYRSRQPYQNNWQGTYNAEPLPVGTYFYVIDFGDGSTPVRGFFVIQR